MIERWRRWAGRLKRETYALYLACGDPRTPWYAKAVAACVAAYAFSPIDLIPDFIPIVGYLDDLVLVPAGIWLAVRLVPREVLAECRERAQARLQSGGAGARTVTVLIIIVWAGVLALAGRWVWRALS